MTVVRGTLAGGSGRRKLPRLFLMTDAVRMPDPLPAAGRLPAGACVIFRHYGLPGRAGLAERLARLCRRRGIVLLIAADSGLAAKVRADGVHLPEHMIGRAIGLKRVRPRWIVTAAVHSESALRRAAATGCDAALLSPAFPTPSHPYTRALGVLRFAALAHRAAIPVIALGGIDIRTLARLKGAGAVGIAGIGLFETGGLTPAGRRKRP